MAAVGGDILEITYNHPTLGTGVIYPKSGEDNTFFVGGLVTESDDMGIDGGGNPIRKINRKRSYFKVTCANDMNNAQEFEKMIALSGSPVAADWTWSVVNGKVYGGSGFPVGDFEANVNAATFDLRVEGANFKIII